MGGPSSLLESLRSFSRIFRIHPSIGELGFSWLVSSYLLQEGSSNSSSTHAFVRSDRKPRGLRKSVGLFGVATPHLLDLKQVAVFCASLRPLVLRPCCPSRGALKYTCYYPLSTVGRTRPVLSLRHRASSVHSCRHHSYGKNTGSLPASFSVLILKTRYGEFPKVVGRPRCRRNNHHWAGALLLP